MRNQQVWAGLPFAHGLHGLAEALPLSLTINTPFQTVGSKPVYTLTGAPPGATVFWSSYKDGVPTGELNSAYSQIVESNGTARLEGSEAWKETDQGTWIKIALVQTPDGANHTAMVQFRVGAAAPAPGSAQAPSGGNFLTDPLFSIGDFEVTGGIALVGGFVLWKLISKR